MFTIPRDSPLPSFATTGRAPRDGTVLVLDVEYPAGRAVLQSLGRHGYRCIAASSRRCPAFVSRYAHATLIYPDPLVNKRSFQDWWLGRQRDESVDFVIPCTESTLMPLHEIRNQSDAKAVLVIPPAESVELVFDKEQFRQLAVRLGLPLPRTRFFPQGTHLGPELFETFAGFPLVVKPARSKMWVGSWGSSLHTRLADDVDSLLQLAERLLPLTGIHVQEWVPGIGVGIEVLAERGRVVMEFAHERIHEYPLTGGASTYRKSILVPEALMEISKELVQALAWHGVAMVEFRVDPSSGSYWLMEMNGRFWGSLPLATFAGADFPVQLVTLYGHFTPPIAKRRPPPVFARNFASDLRWMAERLWMRHPPATARLPPLWRSLLEWFRLFTGRETWDGASWRDPAPIFWEVAVTLRGGLRVLTRRFGRRWHVASMRNATRRSLEQLGPLQRVLVICEGNICRSPYVASRLREWEGSVDFEVRSAGFVPRGNRSSPELFSRLASARGVDLSSHRSQTVTMEMSRWAQAVVIMDRANQRSLHHLDPQAREKTLWLGTFDDQNHSEILDPYGRSVDEIIEAMRRMDRAASSLLERLTTRSHQPTESSQGRRQH